MSPRSTTAACRSTGRAPARIRRFSSASRFAPRGNRGVKMRAAFVISIVGLALYAVLGAQTPAAPKYRFDPDWPKPLPNKWKMGGVTGLAVDRNDDVWVLNRVVSSAARRALDLAQH